MSITPFPSQGQYPWYDQLEQWGADTQAAAESAELNADGLRADVATALSDSTAASAAAIAAAGLVGAPAGDAVLAAISEGGAARGEINDAISEPSGNVTMRSPVDPLADTKRTRYISYQKQEPNNGFNGGEPIWFDTAPLAKNMLTWRLPMNGWAARTVKGAHDGPFNDLDWQRVVWAGAHWFAQDQPDDDNPTVIHGHWSVETPNLEGQLQTRFQIFFNDRDDVTKVGSDVALISTNLSDFMVEGDSRPGGGRSGRFIISGGQNVDRVVEFARGGAALSGRRWVAGINNYAEGGGNAGGDFVIRRHADDGTLLGHSVFIRRSNGEITLGSDAWAPPSTPAQVHVAHAAGAQSGVLVNPTAALTSGAAFSARLQGATEVAFRAQVGGGQARYAVQADGRIGWGDGSAAPDTSLYREAYARLRTDAEFTVGTNLRIGAATAAGGVGVLGMFNATQPPSGVSADAFWMYSHSGRPTFLVNGSVIQLSQQSAVADATDSTDVITNFNSLLDKLRTIGLIAS